MTDDAALRKHLIELLSGHNAHADFEQAIAGLPAKLRGARGKQKDGGEVEQAGRDFHER